MFRRKPVEFLKEVGLYAIPVGLCSLIPLDLSGTLLMPVWLCLSLAAGGFATYSLIDYLQKREGAD